MTTVNHMSRLMRFFLFLKCESIAWSLRRLWCPVSDGDLVLEVGSGGNPYFRANVLLDAYEVTRERHWEPLISDRPTVLGFVEKLPFADKSFDFVIASHVLEHSSDPDSFLKELQRVAKAGYIEVPDAFMERINPYHDHRLEITVRENTLRIRKKNAWQIDSDLVELYEDRVKKIVTQETMRKHPFHFHVRFYWDENINYEILNPEEDAGWKAVESSNVSLVKPGLVGSFKKYMLNVARNIFSQSKRNNHIDIRKLLICPECHNKNLLFQEKSVLCERCNSQYEIKKTIPVMINHD